MPAVAGAYVGATGFFLVYQALLAPTFLTLGVTVALFAMALRAGGVAPPWLAWSALVPVAWSLAGSVAFVAAGPMGAEEIMLLFAPGLMLAMLWVFLAGAWLWRAAPDLAADAAPARPEAVDRVLERSRRESNP